MLLKFRYNQENNDVYLEESKSGKKCEMIDITTDLRTKLLDKNEMTSDKFKIDSNVYFIKKPLFIKLAKAQNRPSIDALKILFENKIIIITGEKSYVFYNGKAINVAEYEIDVDENTLSTHKIT
jgi:hypothetical protein